MPVSNRKYSWAAVGLLLLFFLQGFMWSGCGRMNFPGKNKKAVQTTQADSILSEQDSSLAETLNILADEEVFLVREEPFVLPGTNLSVNDSGALLPVDSLPVYHSLSSDSSAVFSLPGDSLLVDSVRKIPMIPIPDSLRQSSMPDSLVTDSLPADSLGYDAILYDSLGRRYYGKSYLDEVMSGHNTDSVVYDVRAGMVHIYNEGDVTYQNVQLKADYIFMRMEDKKIYANGVPDDSTGIASRPIFIDSGKEYTMDSIIYDLNSEKAKIKGVWTTEGEGVLRGQVIKKMPDNTINIARGKYSTCDADHPHFYVEMTKAKAIPGKKAVFGYSYMVMEDVPLPFLMVPFGFFPLDSDRSSGFIIPSFGEEYIKGFYLREGGYYYVPNDYMDMTFLGGIYTKGSWEAMVNTRYRVRYKFNGGVNFQYSNNKFGDKGSTDYNDEKTYRIQWTHAQDPKFKPGTTFSANVDFSSTQSNRYSPGTINDFATNQTNSSISYQRNWAGTPFSMSVNLSHSQTNRDSTYSFTFPNMTFNMSRINPFKFKNRKAGPERWYEKISLSYNNSLNNSVSNVKEYDLFKQEMFDKMDTRMSHNLPVNASFTLFNYINVNPNFTYRENWNTKKIEQKWDPTAGRVVRDTVKGFHRVYDYSASVSASTTIYGMYDNFNPNSRVKAIRHTITPTVSFNYRPDFGKPKYGFYFPYQTNADGAIGYYSPYQNAPGQGKTASMNVSINQTLESKYLTRRDSVEKKKIIDELSFSFSYNFAADSMKLSRSVPVRLRSTLIPGFNINLTTSLGLYEVDRDGRTIDKLRWNNGKAPRVETLGTSFNWSRSYGKGNPNARNTGTNMVDQQNMFNDGTFYDPYDPNNMINQQDPNIGHELQEDVAALHAYRNLLSSQYYDFSVPLNINFSYSINYRNNGVKKEITQTASFGGSVNLTPKWGLSVQSGYDFQAKKIIPTTSFNLTRDLHCWQMNFSWVPLGPMKSWNFHISVKANVLRDLKYEKRGSRFDETNGLK